MMDGIELACERAGLDLHEMETVLGCVRHHLNHGMRPGTPEEMLRGAIGRCWGAEDCGLCPHVLETISKEETGVSLALATRLRGHLHHTPTSRHPDRSA